MFHYLLVFLLINSYCQSLGNPIQQNNSLALSLSDLAKNCENVFLANAIKAKLKDCAISIIHTPLNKTQIGCLMFYDINKKLCSFKKIPSFDDFESKVLEKEDINKLCTFAKDWIFTDLSEYDDYRNSTETLKYPSTCGVVCGADNDTTEANYFCKYYKQGIEVLKMQMSTESNVNHNKIDPAVIPEPESNGKSDINVRPQPSQTKTLDLPNKQSQLPVPKSALDNPDRLEDSMLKSLAPTSKQMITPDSVSNIGKDEAGQNVGLQRPVLVAPKDDVNDQSGKPTSNNESNAQSDPSLSAKDSPLNVNQNDGVIPNDDANDPEYGDVNEDGDVEDEGQGSNIKPPSGKEPSSSKNSIPPQNNDNSQKVSDLYTNSESFSDDSDNFFPFFLTAIILVVLLYVLYHNKNKVSKVFFGLLLEGRQGRHRRNSRGHAYRRLDTLEQAMSANTAAPPSKIIY